MVSALAELAVDPFADVALPCHARRDHDNPVDCDQEATWSVEVVCEACGARRSYICDDCHERLLEILALMVNDEDQLLGWCRFDGAAVFEVLELHRLR